MFSFFPCCSVHSFRLKKNDSAYLSHGSDNVLHSLSCLRISCLHTWRRLSWVREGSKANLDIKQLMSWEIALLNFSLFCFPFWSIIDDGSPYPRAPKISLCSSLLLILVAFNTSTSFDHFFLAWVTFLNQLNCQSLWIWILISAYEEIDYSSQFALNSSRPTLFLLERDDFEILDDQLILIVAV